MAINLQAMMNIQTVFANYSMGMATFGMQYSEIDVVNGTDQENTAWGLAVNVNDNLSLSYGEREIDFKPVGGIVQLLKKVKV